MISPCMVSRVRDMPDADELLAGDYESMTREQIQKFKAQQSLHVASLISAQGLVHARMVLREVDWFYNKLGIDDFYFLSTKSEGISSHIQSIYAGKILAVTSGQEQEFELKFETADSAMFALRSDPSTDTVATIKLEEAIENRYLHEGLQPSPLNFDSMWRINVYRSAGTVAANVPVQLRFYFLIRPNFPAAGATFLHEPRLQAISDISFFKNTSGKTHQLYDAMIQEAISQLHPVVRVMETQVRGEMRLVVAYAHGSTNSLFSSLNTLFFKNGLFANKKYLESFANGVKIISSYLRALPPTEPPSAELVASRCANLLEQVSVVFVLPNTLLTQHFTNQEVSANEMAYAFCAWKFSHQFLNRYSQEYASLLRSVQKFEASTSTPLLSLLSLKQHLKKDIFTEDRVFESIVASLPLVKLLYADFASRHNPLLVKSGAVPCSTEDLQSQIKKMTNTETDLLVFHAFAAFNENILQTNFFLPTKTAFSFHLCPKFLDVQEFVHRPVGIYMVVGSEFRAFHVRFREIARGGVRIVKSANPQQYVHNVGSLFDEVFSLSLTQQRKNKDIPEGGSKAVIFLSLRHQDKSQVAFRKFVDALLDLLIPNEAIVNLHGKPVMLFLGPDENTAGFMDWAARHARRRGYTSLWKSFTTGKSPALGGIPHDVYGMTSLGVREYIVGALAAKGWDESQVTSFQTGGPDGDLGSNNLKLGQSRTVAIVDASGVLYHPDGLDSDELHRLAAGRQTCSHFSPALLGAAGFFVGTDSRDIALPDGTVVENGLWFRDNFQFSDYCRADLFVPCGGRPEAVSQTNVARVFGADGKPRWKVIVEGANLFFSSGARLELERAGVVLFPDQAANKGGVMSSSLEVLAALALTDEQYAAHMQVVDEQRPPPFYQAFVVAVQATIRAACRNEFLCIEREYAISAQPRSKIADDIAVQIDALNMSICASHLWDNVALRTAVLRQAAPPPLIELIGLESMLQCVPEAYLRAMFGAKLASDFVYHHGLNPPGAAFIDFLVVSISAAMEPAAAAAAERACVPLPTAPLAEVAAANPAS